MSTVTGRYFIDRNGSHTEDQNDSGIAGAKVYLYTNSKLVATTTTNASGAYVFTGVDPGFYYAKFENSPLGAGFVKSGVVKNDNIDSDVWKTDHSGAGVTGSFYVGANRLLSNIDAGVAPATRVAPADNGSETSGGGTVKGRYFHDKNKNNQEDGIDSGIGHATVNLMRGNTVVASTKTDAGGNYEFKNVGEGGYTVQFAHLDGFKFSRGNSGANDRIDSDVVRVNPDGSGKSVYFVMRGGNTVNHLDAGVKATSSKYTPPVVTPDLPVTPQPLTEGGSIKGRYFVDKNGNHVENADDSGVGKASVSLIKAGVVVATTQTNDSGYYAFNGLADGWYSVAFDNLAGHSFVRGNAGNNDAIDSDVWRSFKGDGQTASFQIRQGNTISNVDAGIKAQSEVVTRLLPFVVEPIDETPGTISGRLFDDKNGNGINNFETGGPRTDVLLVNQSTGKIVDVTQTEANGWYTFKDVPPGTYAVRMKDIGGGKVITTANAGNNDKIDSDAIGQWGGGTAFTASFDVKSGANISNVDFGYVDKETEVEPLIPVTPKPKKLVNDLPDEISIIHVGNSYQFFGEAENWASVQFSTMLEVSGVDVTVRRIGIGSSNLEVLWKNSDAARLLEVNDYDLLFLNGLTTVIYDGGSALFDRYLDIFTDHAAANGTETVLFGLWAFDQWISVSGGDTFGPAAHKKYYDAASAKGLGYSPTGMAMAEAHKQLSQIYGNGDDGKTAEDLLTRDYVHATPLGGYLAANVLFETTFGQSAPAANVWRPDGVSLADAKLMQAIAADIVEIYAITPDIDLLA